MRYHIKPSTLQGSVTIPSSKSHTLRAILFASLADGESTIHRYLTSPDTNAMIHACKLLGAHINDENDPLTIVGTHGKLITPENIIDAGNSGQVLRFIAAVSALTSGYTVITGDRSIRTQRPIQPLLDGLNQLGVFAVSAKNNGQAPIIIKGPLCGGETTLNGEDSQPVSGLLIASAFAENKTTIHVKNPGEKPWINLTLNWFKRLGIAYQHHDHILYEVAGNSVISGFDYTVPGDFSSCAYPLAAAIVTNSEIILNNLDMNDIQGDKEIITLLQEMGASIEANSSQRTLHVKKSNKLVGKKIDVNHIIDAVPILAVIACFTESETIIEGAEIARKKESDRLFVITHELQKMGANITEFNDGLIIKPSQLKGANVQSHNDHRIAMSLCVAALAAQGDSVIENCNCIAKSYPNFAASLQKLGVQIEVVP